ncbi:MAG: FecR domain-containing protein [Bacteroidetes bacterium]|nr:FecR domain-containing protein [Bacteroidota bacterium]
MENRDDLIAKMLSGNASKEEIALVEAWKNGSTENNAYFESSKKLFSAINDVKIEYNVNTVAAWNKLDERISKETKVIPLFKRAILMRVAASLLLLVALGFLIKFIIDPKEMQPIQYTAVSKTVLDTLPDGSKVFINKNSEISYVADKNTRRVKLRGEAYFEVVHNEKQPFEIVINDVVIKDIGTAFNVKALPGTNTIEVVVESGEVQFYTSTDSGLNLTKGQKAIYNIATKQFVKGVLEPAENVASYRSRVFNFNATPLNEVIKQINNVYDVNIDLADEQLENKELSVEFNNEPVDVVISIIAETLDLEIERRDTSVILKSKTKVQP